MKRLESVDALRGLAILLVVIFHYVNHALSPVFLEANPLVGKLVLQVTSLAWAGVDLFFVISGFLIGSIFIKNGDAENFVSVYFARRALRIVPMYAVTLLAFLAFLHFSELPTMPGGDWLFDGFFGLQWYVLFIQNIAIALNGDGGPNWLGITWSLAVEEQFYVLSAVMFLTCSRRTVIGICLVGILVIAPVSRLALDHLGGWHAYYALLPSRADLFCCGILIALAMSSPAGRRQVTDALSRRPLWVLGALLALIVMVKLQGWISSSVMVSVGYTGIMAVAGGLLLSALVGLPWTAPLSNSVILRWLGLRCFSIYLLHMPVQGMVYLLLLGSEPAVDSWWGWLLQVVILASTLGLSAIAWLAVERPFIRIGARLRYRPSVSMEESRAVDVVAARVRA